MSILDNLEKKYNVQQNNGEQQSQTYNLPVKITGYENNEYFIGERLDTKELVKVKLRPVEKKGDHSRPEVTDFQDKKNHKRYAPPGDSIILFDSAYQEKDGTWNARWANVLHKTRMPSTVLILPATVRFVEDVNNKYVQVRVVKNQAWINSMEDLEYHLKKALHPKGSGARPYAHIRLVSSEGEKRVYTVSPKMEEVVIDNEKIKIPADGNTSYEEFINNEKNQMLIEACSMPEITVEVLYCSALYLGADTRDRFLSTPAIRNIIEPAYLLDKKAEKGIKNYGYKPSVIALREVADVNGLMFITEVKPLINNSEAISILELQK